MRLPAVPNPRFPPRTPRPTPAVIETREGRRRPRARRVIDARGSVAPPTPTPPALGLGGDPRTTDRTRSPTPSLTAPAHHPSPPAILPGRVHHPRRVGGRHLRRQDGLLEVIDARGGRGGERDAGARATEPRSPGRHFNNNENTFVPSSPATDSARRYDTPLLTAVPTRFASLRTCVPWAGCRTRRASGRSCGGRRGTRTW